MTFHDTNSEHFRSTVAELLVPAMGTQIVAPILASLIQFARPRRVFEVGMGYTTPFIAAALAGVEQQVRAEAQALRDKNQSYLDTGLTLDEQWLYADPALLTPGYYLEPYQTTFVAVDNLSIADSSAAKVQNVLGKLGLADQVTVVNADLRDCRELLPDELTPIDLAWVDAWECLFFFDSFWELINPQGGLVVMHYLMTYPEGEAILDYISKVQKARPGELEILNLLEPHKLVQNSLTVLRRTSAGKAKSHAEPGGKLAYDAALDDAKVLSSLTSQGDRRTSTPDNADSSA